MTAVSLFFVFALAKLAILAGHTIPLSPYSPSAYFWQDALAALTFALAARWLPRRMVWIFYGALSLYAALNIPIGRALSTPLTLTMLRAARGPLADSFLIYATWINVLLIATTLTAAAALPRLIPKTRPRPWLLAGLLLVAAGPFAAAHVDSLGLERNVVAALLLPARITAMNASGDWRHSPFPQRETTSLSQFRNIARGRNVVMISLESTAAQYLRLYGGQYDVMPNLGALAQNAIVFDNAYSVYPESIKGLFSVLCSVFPGFGTTPELYENVPCHSIATVLRDTGYSTALFHSGRFAFLGMESIVRNRGFQTLEDAGDIGGNHESSFGVDEPATIARMLSWIDALPRGQQFFLTYLPIAGHHPYATPAQGPFPDPDEIGRYRNALHYSDQSLATLIEGLRQRNLDQNTIWIIYGDHGEAFGQHEGNYAHTFFVYEENVHVPFLVIAPGAIKNQTRVTQAVSLVDTAPTILDLLGIQADQNYQGWSMLDGQPRMALFFTDYSLGILGLRDGPWKFTWETASGRSRLFNLDTDPQEKTNLAAYRQDRVVTYRRSVKNWTASQNALLNKNHRH